MTNKNTGMQKSPYQVLENEMCEDFFKKFPHLYGSLYSDFLRAHARKLAESAFNAAESQRRKDEFFGV